MSEQPKKPKVRDFEFGKIPNTDYPDVALAVENAHHAIQLYQWELGVKTDERIRNIAREAAKAGQRGIRVGITLNVVVEALP